MKTSALEVIDVPSSSSSAITPSSQLSFKSANASGVRSDPGTPEIEYRLAKLIPFELQEHCAIYLEEGLCIVLAFLARLSLIPLPDLQALNFLISLVTAGAASPTPTPALLPPPQFLRLISTLTVHPTLTTRAKTADRLQAANLAHYYLRLVLKLAGPIQSDNAEAFKYSGIAGRTIGRRRTTEASPENEHASSIENDLANSAAIFTQAESFWQVVGWAFNCSISYRRRWDRWSLWLEYMVEVLEVDWKIRYRADEMEQSLVVQYIISGGGQSDSGRRIIRAIFADGRKTAIGEWKEIWQNETKELRKEDDVKKAEKAINIEADDYGDYVSDEDDAELEDVSSHSIVSSRSDSQTKKSAQAPSAHTPNSADNFGGPSALNLRIRLLSLLSKVAHYHPSALTWSAQQVTNGTERLYDILLEHIRPLTLPSFFLFMSPSYLRSWDPTVVSVFTQYVLHRGSLIEGGAPEPASYVLTEASLLECHLPWAASNNGAADNAKVNICVENLLRLYDRYGPGLTCTQELEDLAEKGIKKREDKAKIAQQKRGRKRKAGSSVADESEEWTVLRESAARIRLLLQLVKESCPASQGTQEIDVDTG